MSSTSSLRVGYWVSEKKCRKLNLMQLTEVCRASGIELVKLDLEKPLEDQGPFAAIVHKMSDFLVKAKCGDLQAKAICESFQKYVDSHPNMAIIDPLPNIEKLLDRYLQYKLVEESELCKEGDIFIPAFVELTSMNVAENVAKLKSAHIDFPIVCKPSMAHGPLRSHQMCLIFNKEGLKDISIPCVVQKFINHNAVLYKLFIIGNEYFIIERPSLKNFFAGDQETIYFESNDVSKPNSASELTELEDNESYVPVVWPEKEKMDSIVQVLHERCGLNLLGIDVIVDNETGHYAIVDMNVFPGYYEAGNFHSMLTNLILKKIHLKEASLLEEPYKPILLENLSTLTLQIKEKNRDTDPSNPILNPLNAVESSESSPLKKNRPNEVKCFCCPISGASCNTVNSKNDLPSEMHRCHSGVPLKDEMSAEPTDNLLNQKQIGIAEDSGVETSDSCDEKKKKTCYRTVKHLHSKTVELPVSR